MIKDLYREPTVNITDSTEILNAFSLKYGKKNGGYLPSPLIFDIKVWNVISQNKNKNKNPVFINNNYVCRKS